MKLSRRARYALRMMVAIERHTSKGEKVSLSKIAQLTNLSRRYMEQLAIGLKNASLVVGISGKNGGYRLARPAGKIRLVEIVEAAIGPIDVAECVSQPESCGQSMVCECRWLYEQINRRVKDLLNGVTLAGLARRNWPREEIVANRANSGISTGRC